MNKRLTVKTDDGRVRFCVLDGGQGMAEQLSVMLDIKQGYGLAVRVDEAEIRIVDYYRNETLGRFAVLAVEDTALPVSLVWSDISAEEG